MEEFNVSRTIPDFEDKRVNELVKSISINLLGQNRVTDSLIYDICKLRELIKGCSRVSIKENSEVEIKNNIYKLKYDFFDITTQIFGFKKRTIQKILACKIFLNDEFCQINNGKMKPGFHGFSLTKLFELLPLKEKACQYVAEGYIVSSYTVQEVRVKVQELLGKEVKQKDKNVNDFDLNEEYTLNDFKTRWTKSGLIDIAFSLYTNYRGYLLGQKKK